MRVALVYQKWNHPTQPYLAETLRALGGRGIELGVYSRSSPDCGEGSGECHILRGPSGIWGGITATWRAVQTPLEAAAFWRLCKGAGWRKASRDWLDLWPLMRSGADILHLQNSQLSGLLRPLFQRDGLKTVVSFRGFDTAVRPLEDEDWRATLQEIYRKADALHFVSRYLMEEAIRLGAPAEHCHVIRPGVDTRFFDGSAGDTHGSVLRLVTTGRLVWEKALPLALLTAHSLKRRGIPLQYVLAGDGPEKRMLLHWARRLELGEEVTLCGLVGREKLRELLRSCSVYFQPSVSDALGVAILEAQAMGLPVVATRVGGIHEAVLDGETGRLLPFGDVEGLADAIQELWESPGKRKSMGEAGRRWVEQRFSVEREAAEWVKLYKDLCSKRA